ncbi:MAG TPA: outer membrane protein assembly factor BamE [Burkholderiales bacterium]|jgi:outer membrane protein assembly factor BamE (lipoprotein component of BamABCDE complex)|nr:outer membrane protein assembly factor BamE [Burkholderiales bacterium]
MTTSTIKVGFVLSLAVLLSACATTLGRDFNEEYAQQIKSGETTKAEVLGKLGRPVLRKGGKEEETWTYAYYTGGGMFGWFNTWTTDADPQYGFGNQKRLIVVFSGDVVKSSTFRREIPEPQ